MVAGQALRLELVGGPFDGAWVSVPAGCPCCGRPVGGGHFFLARGGARYLIADDRRLATYRPVRAPA